MENVRIGIVGTNFISDWFAEAAKGVDGVEIYAVFSRNIDTGNAFAAKYGIKKVYTDYGELISDKDIDGIYVASPTVCHKEHAKKAIEGGKTVLCEKMICEGLKSFLEISSISRNRGVVLLEAMRPLFDPAYEVVREYISRIGKVRRASLVYCQYSSRYDKFKSGVIENAFRTEMKNSALADIGIYPLNTAVRLFGEPLDITSRSVFLDNGFEGAGIALLDYGEFIASVSYSKINDSCEPSLIEGEDGAVYIDKISSPTSVRLVLRDGREEQRSFSPGPTNMIYEIEAFRDMVNGVRDYLPYLDHTEAVMRCVDRIYESSGVTFPREE